MQPMEGTTHAGDKTYWREVLKEKLKDHLSNCNRFFMSEMNIFKNYDLLVIITKRLEFFKLCQRK